MKYQKWILIALVSWLVGPINATLSQIPLKDTETKAESSKTTLSEEANSGRVYQAASCGTRHAFRCPQNDRPLQVQLAIKDVTKVLKRLEGVQKRDEKLYTLEIEGWRIQSKIDLLLAKGMAKDKSFNESDLKQLLDKRIDNQIQRTNREIELIEQRKASLMESIAKLTNNRQSQVDKQYANMLKRLKGDKPKARDQAP